MKKYTREKIILILQLFMFYIFPLFAGPTDAMGMVILILMATLLLSYILGMISNNKIKFLYPFVISILFIPSVFIYYNESARIHAIWYLVVAVIGLLIGSMMKFTTSKLMNMSKKDKMVYEKKRR